MLCIIHYYLNFEFLCFEGYFFLFASILLDLSNCFRVRKRYLVIALEFEKRYHFFYPSSTILCFFWIAYSALSNEKAFPYQFGLVTISGFREHSHITRTHTNRNQLVNIYLIGLLDFYFIELTKWWRMFEQNTIIENTNLSLGLVVTP